MRRFSSASSARLIAVLLGAMALAPSPWANARAAEAPTSFRDRPPEDEVIYFLLPDRFANGDPSNDRGGLSGDRLATGFDPTSKAFYNGGDLKGVLQHLDYIQGLGATTIWVAPIFKNKPVSGGPGHESAGYHGYWITDFTDVDPHFGTRADFKALVDAAHARGMKVYMDIVANHTADVIRYRECPDRACPYRSKADYPYVRKGGIHGPPINAGFQGDDAAHQTVENFSRLTSPDWAYTPYVPAGEEHEKKPDWLNDPIYYHNRGGSIFKGESSTYGDFGGLDDLQTEDPRVVKGFIDIYGQWIDDFGVDGFRIDTARHVNPEFWRAFIPAMLARAKARGVPNFHIFGEVYDPDPAILASFTRDDAYPAVLDFGFQAAVTDVVAKNQPPSRLARLFAADADFEGGAAGARRLPTFLGNHDMGRFAWFVKQADPAAGEDEIQRRVILGHAMMFFLRGQPVIYAGDEQGFVGTGGDQDSRQSLYASRVPEYLKTPLIGTTTGAGQDHFDPSHPIYRALAEMAAIRSKDPALRRGDQVIRAAGEDPGLFAVSRHDPDTGAETLVVFNTSRTPITAQVSVDDRSRTWRALHGTCASAAAAPTSYPVSVAGLDYIICTSPGVP